ncbi:signal transduction histidine kinase [Mycobacteroides abscessus subsp. abscessus]|nr:signal transduction histidine kinase [Mycobacteroides abscessus subsp. abscessus]
MPVPDRADEISALAATMNKMLEKKKIESMTSRRFVGDASHELRSPLLI